MTRRQWLQCDVREPMPSRQGATGSRTSRRTRCRVHALACGSPATGLSCDEISFLMDHQYQGTILTNQVCTPDEGPGSQRRAIITSVLGAIAGSPISAPSTRRPGWVQDWTRSASRAGRDNGDGETLWHRRCRRRGRTGCAILLVRGGRGSTNDQAASRWAAHWAIPPAT